MWSAWPKSGLTTRASTTVSFLVFRADRVSAEKTRGEGILVAVSDGRTGLERAEECVCVEIPSSDDFILLVGNQYLRLTQLCEHLSRILPT